MSPSTSPFALCARKPDAEALTSIFGRWPSFHDAEVVRLRLDRGLSGESGPSLEADIYLFELTSEVSPAGFYVLRHNTLATLRFEDIENLQIAGFHHTRTPSSI